MEVVLTFEDVVVPPFVRAAALAIIDDGLCNPIAARGMYGDSVCWWVGWRALSAIKMWTKRTVTRSGMQFRKSRMRTGMGGR